MCKQLLVFKPKTDNCLHIRRWTDRSEQKHKVQRVIEYNTVNNVCLVYEILKCRQTIYTYNFLYSYATNN
jgi:hypothetical protein